MVALIVGFGAFAQNSKVTSAANYLRYNELDKAKANIDAASEHEKTMGNAKTWFYRGNIYKAIYVSKEEKYKALDPDALLTAVNSYAKALKLPAKKVNVNELSNSYSQLGNICFDIGVQRYNAKNYKEAGAYFKKAMNVNSHFKVIDTLAMYNVGLTAEKDKNFTEAKVYYNKCKDLGFRGAKMYSHLSDIAKAEGNDEAALKSLAEGRAKYPNDQFLLTDEINIFLKLGKTEQALENLNKAVANDADNASLHYAKGTINQKKGNKEQAAKDYQRAIELNPEYFDANYNLGALYFNNGADCINEISSIKDNSKYAEAKKGCDKTFEQAIPFLEKAHALNPNDVATMQSLKQLYVRVGNTEKYNEMKGKLEN